MIPANGNKSAEIWKRVKHLSDFVFHCETEEEEIRLSEEHQNFKWVEKLEWIDNLRGHTCIGKNQKESL